MAVATYTKAGTKATTPAKLDKTVFDVEVKNHQLLKDAYLAYTANGRTNNAVTKKRGEVRGGGRKPWRQKGTGNARFGSSRNPIWRGGGIAFGPTGNENYSHKLNTSAKHTALRQALSLVAKEERIKVIETFSVADGKAKTAANLLVKLNAKGTVLIVVSNKDASIIQATANLQGTKLVNVKYLNVFDVTNADVLVFEKSAIDDAVVWLGGNK